MSPPAANWRGTVLARVEVYQLGIFAFQKLGQVLPPLAGACSASTAARKRLAADRNISSSTGQGLLADAIALDLRRFYG
jgi:hypothetical protein